MRATSPDDAAHTPNGAVAITTPRPTPVPLPEAALLPAAIPPISVPPRSLIKRGVDFTAALVALVLLSPLLLLVALLVATTTSGPAFIVQERVGRDGRLFRMLKFRTMINGAEHQREDVIGAPDDGILDRYRADPRITPVGRLLRRWSIDELPQLLNVLGGSMSLVGPRPILPEELPYLSGDAQRRHCVKPGLTGLWQVSGRKSVCWDDRMRLDVRYVDEWSPSLDMRIVARTLSAVIAGDGAF